MEANSTSLQKQQQNSLGATVIRQLSTESQYRWIEAIFSRLSAIYGDRFGSMWSSVNHDDMKKTWIDALGGFSGNVLKLALNSCLEEPHCPNLPAFVSICRKHAIHESKPVNIDDPIPKDQAAKIIAEASKRAGLTSSDKYDYLKWAKNIVRDYENGEYRNEHGYRMAKQALSL